MAKLTGTINDDTIIGAIAISDTLNGAAGDDLLFGYGDAKGGVGLPPPSPDITAGGGKDNDLLNGGLGDDTIQAGNGNDTLLGGDGIDQLFGDWGADRLDGGTGADSMDGGDGDDVYIVDNAGDKAAEQFTDAFAGTDLVLSSVSFTLGFAIENLTLTGKGANSGTGNDFNNLITGNAAANTLSGAAGNDTLNGMGGADSLAGGLDNDIYIVDNAGDKISEAALEGTDTIRWMLNKNMDLAAYAEIENATLLGVAAVSLTGTAGNNVLEGNAGANKIDGGGGDDTLAGGGGNDTYIADGGDTIVELAGGGIDTVLSSIDITLADNVENLKLNGAGLAGFGNDLKNVITGTGGTDLLDGGGGADTLIGGGGGDEYNVAEGDVIIETQVGTAGGNDRVFWQGSGAYTLGANLEELSLGASATNGTGNALDNAIFGNGSNNILDGKAGADFMRGEPGNDTYIVDNPGDQAVEILFGGTDHVLSSVTYTIGANIENLTLTGKAAIDGNGNELDNRLIGNGAANKLSGNNGIDTLLGGAGNDTLTAGDINDVTDVDLLDGGPGADKMIGSINGATVFIVDNIGDKVLGIAGEVHSSVSFDLEGTGVGNLILTGNSAISGFGSIEINRITGNGAANKLFGLDGPDVLIGNGGNDTLDGGQSDGHADGMRGGAGNDLYLVGFEDEALEDMAGAAGGIDTVVCSTVEYFLGANIENLTLVGTASLGFGNDLANKIIGNDADNTLSGAGGADTMAGGKGNDAYSVDDAGDKIVELAGGGTDKVSSSVGFTLSAELENLFLTGGSSKGTGNAKDNIIVGGSGNDTLDGKAGADKLDGQDGDDTLIVDNLADTTSDSGTGIDLVLSSVSHAIGAGIDNLTLTGKAAINGTGNGLNNQLTGNGGANVLNGGAGSDTLIGGAGNDTLSGGADADVFIYLSGAAGKDTITDFIPGLGDAIDISDMLTGYVGGISNIHDFVQLAFTGGDTILRVDANGLAGGSKFTDVAVLTGSINQSVDQLVTNGNLVVT